MFGAARFGSVYVWLLTGSFEFGFNDCSGFSFGFDWWVVGSVVYDLVSVGGFGLLFNYGCLVVQVCGVWFLWFLLVLVRLIYGYYLMVVVWFGGGLACRWCVIRDWLVAVL